MLLHALEEDGARRSSVEIVVALVTKFKLPNRVDHGSQGRIFTGRACLLGFLSSSLEPGFLSHAKLLLDRWIEVRVVEVDVRHKLAQQRLRSG